jgi:hypothetical protein
MDKAAFYAVLRQRNSGVFSTSLKAGQVQGLEVILDSGNGLPITHLAYLLATAYHETGATIQPIREAYGKTDADAVNRLERAWAKGQLKWVKTPYWRYDMEGKAWFGRGYVQLTHKANYAKAAALTGADLLGNPSLAMVPSIAAKILIHGSSRGMFTGRSLSDYLPGDYVGARKVINGTDKAALIAGYAVTFEAALRAAKYSPIANAVPVTPATTPSAPAASTGLLAAIIAAVVAFFALRKG